jgi:predicted ferric reductase
LRLAVFIGLNILWGWNSVEYSTDYKLYGWLTIANGGLALLMAARSNLFALVIRIPSATLLMYHRWIGLATMVHATIHFALNTRHDIVTDQLAEAFASRRIQVGVMAWIALCIIAITSISFIRRRWFEVFYYSHALFFVFVVGALIHATKGPEFLLPGLFLWVIDRVIRFVNNFRSVTVKSVTQYPGDVTKFKIEGLKTSHAGQITFMQIPGVSFLNWHPFTIASAPGDKETVLAVRGLGGYTKKLQNNIGAKLDAREGDKTAGARVLPPTISLKLDGPYGVGNIQWGLDPVTVLVAGGIGITPGMSIASHIIQRATLPDAGKNSSSQWHIHLLWIIKDIRHTQWFEEELKHLASLAEIPGYPVTFDITIHYTGASASRSSDTGAGEEYAMEEPYKYEGPGAVFRGRPDIAKWFDGVKTLRYGMDAAVNACGPRHMIDSARKAAAKASWEKGLFHVEEEVFEF